MADPGTLSTIQVALDIEGCTNAPNIVHHSIFYWSGQLDHNRQELVDPGVQIDADSYSPHVWAVSCSQVDDQAEIVGEPGLMQVDEEELANPPMLPLDEDVEMVPVVEEEEQMNGTHDVGPDLLEGIDIDPAHDGFGKDDRDEMDASD